VRALLGVVPDRPVDEQLAYVTAVKTGATKDSVARQLRVTRGTVNRWLAGSRKPSRRSQGKIKALFDRFWMLNNRVGTLRGDEMLRVSSPGGITVKGKQRDHLVLEQGVSPRDWQRLRDASVREINADSGKLFVDALVEIPYVSFGPGTYTIETM
jgi:hypothetical protein